MATIDIAPADLAIVRDVLAARLPAEVRVWIFGSRVTGTARRYSDLDLALQGHAALGRDMLGELADALSEADLTIKIDLVDLRQVDPDFRRRIEREMVPLSVRE